MLREPAVRSLLLEDVCNLPKADETDAENPSAAGTDPRLLKALRRAVLVITGDWVALLALFLLRSSDRAWIPLGPTEDSIFTLGILAISVHSGFRLGQLEKLRSVSRALEDLRERASAL
jgi:hypothetical protein